MLHIDKFKLGRSTKEEIDAKTNVTGTILTLIDTIDIKPQLDAALISNLRRDNLLAPSTSSWTSSSRRNSVIDESIFGATRGMQMLNFL